jgi:hypothetical protein
MSGQWMLRVLEGAHNHGSSVFELVEDKNIAAFESGRLNIAEVLCYI